MGVLKDNVSEGLLSV